MNTGINGKEFKHTPHCEAPHQNFVHMNLYIKEIIYWLKKF